MKRVVILALAALMVFAGATYAEPPPAGVVVYTQVDGEVYLLLAEHGGSKRGWAAFGGGAREGETPEETAAQKGHEESRGYYSREELLAKIQGQKPVMDGEFACYFAEVDFVPAQRVMNNPVPDAANDAYTERSTFAWIPYSAVERYLARDIERRGDYPIDPLYLPAGSETNTFWSIWLSNMRKAVVGNALPWKAMK